LTVADRYTHAEQIGRLADRVDNLAHALQLPLPAAMHVEQLRAALPEIRDALRLIYTAETGDDPWSTHPRGVMASDGSQP
jgi:hypothetical protein